MASLIQDVRYAVRLLLRQPGFSTAAILTLALGIGMSTAIATVIDAAMLHPLPYPNPERLAYMGIAGPDSRGTGSAPSVQDLRTIRTVAGAPVTLAMWRNIFRPPVADGPSPERLTGQEIDQSYLDLLGIAPIRGRGIVEADMLDGAPPVVLIGYDYWQRRFGGRDDAVGQVIYFDLGEATIIGVLPSSFERTAPIFRPLRVDPRQIAGRGTGTATYVRLKDGVSIDRAQRELTRILSGLPGWRTDDEVRLQPLLERSTSGYWTTSNVLAGAVGLILLLGCVNVAGLLLARGSSRAAELSIRASIGAGRARLVRQLLTESLVLAVAGGALGILLAAWTLDALVTNIPLPISIDAPHGLNWRIFGFSAALTMLTGVLFGLLPAWRLSRVQVSSALARGSRRGGTPLSRRGGQSLIAAEVALAVILLTGAGLMIRSFGRMVGVDLGFDPEPIVTLEARPVDLNAQTFSTYYPALLDAIRMMPGVAAAGAINHLPLMGGSMYASATTDAGTSFGLRIRQVLPGYFEAMGLMPRQGRFPTQSDYNSGQSVLVLNQKAAAKAFPDGSPIGRSLTMITDKEQGEVIGVVGDMKTDGPLRDGEVVEAYRLYRPFTKGLTPDGTPESLIVVVRPTGSRAGLPERLRQAAQQVGPRALVSRVRNGDEWLDDRVVTPRQRTVLLALLGGLGLLLTLVGVFGTTAYAVARRTREMGVRIALGARPADAVRAIVADAAWPVGIGVATGLGGAWWATRLISTFLFQTTPTDMTTFVVAAVIMTLTGVVAAWLPARRAARVDPVTALRTE